MRARRRMTRPACGALLALGLVAAGCSQQMADGGHLKPFEGSELFDDGSTARPAVANTVARGELIGDELRRGGTVGGETVDRFPFDVDLELLRRGRERYDIFCSPCHDRVGNGNGMVVQRGFRRPASLHIPRLREAPAGYFFDVVSNGFGAMPSYAARVPVDDRWAIVAYVRALQLSQGAAIDDVPPDERATLQGQE